MNINPIKEYVLKNLFFIIIIILLISLISILSFSIYLKTSSSISIDSISKKINTLNSNIKDFDEFSKSNEKVILSSLNDLNLLRDTILELDINESDKTTKTSLLKIIDNNILLHKSTLALFNNPSNFNDEFNEFNYTYTEFINELNTNPTFKISLSEDFYTFFNDLKKYSNNKIEIDAAIKLEKLKTQNFLSSIESYSIKLDNIAEDLETPIRKIKEDNRSLAFLIDEVNQKKLEILDLKRSVKTLAVPDNCKNAYSSFLISINSYESYLSSLENALFDDINSDMEDESSIFIYTSTFNKYKPYKTNLEAFNEEISLLK